MNLREKQQHEFLGRHIGITATETTTMLQTIGMQSVEELIDKTVPASIRLPKDLDVSAPMSEFDYLQHINELGKKNKLMKQIKFMKNHQSVFSCTNFQLKKNNNIKKIKVKKNKIFFNDLLTDRPIALSSVVILRDVILNVAKYNNSDTYAEDYLWWVLILKKNYCCDVIKSNLTTINIIKNSRSVKFLLNYMALIRIYNENLKISFGRIFVIVMLLIYNTFSKNLFKYKFFFLNK